VGNQLRIAFFALAIIDIGATMALWMYIFKQGVMSMLLLALAAAWVFAIVLLIFICIYLMLQRGSIGTSPVGA
jgi:hypothetical protein